MPVIKIEHKKNIIGRFNGVLTILNLLPVLILSKITTIRKK